MSLNPKGFVGRFAFLIVACAWGSSHSTFAQDCNNNGIDDACDIDCGLPAGPCDVPGCGGSPDCNGNGVPDECDVVGSFLVTSPTLSPFTFHRNADVPPHQFPAGG